MRITGAEALIHSLIKNNVEVIFGYPGGTIKPVYNILRTFQDRLRHVLCRHEQGAVHAAEGYACVSKKAGVCMVSSGPGSINLVTGIAEAMMDSTPLICITGQVVSSCLGKDAFQESDILSITASITKWSIQVTSAEEIASSIAKAFYYAQSGRPGPVVVDITKDAQLGMVDFFYSPYQNSAEKKVSFKPNLLEIIRAAELINQSLRPCILVGHGVLLSGAEEEVRVLAERAEIPVVSTLLGLSVFPTEHPLYAGMVGVYGNHGANLIVHEADVIIALGMRFEGRATGPLENYAKKAHVIHIDIDEVEFNKNVEATVCILADVKEVVRTLLGLVLQQHHTAWVKKHQEYALFEYENFTCNELFPQKGPIKMAEVIRALSNLDKGESIIVSDVGQNQIAVAWYYRFKKSNSFVTSGGMGTMGFAVPAAIGVQLGAPNSLVIAVVGDGGFQMTIQELAVISQEKLPVKIVILNNEYLGMIIEEEVEIIEHHYGTMHNPDFIKIAQGYGILARKVTDRGEVVGALSEMLESKEAYILEFFVENKVDMFFKNL